MSVSNKIALDVTALLRARNPLLWVVTREEARVEGYLIEAAAAAGYKAWSWDCAAGVADLGGNKVQWGSTDPGEMLGTILARSESSRERGVWIMRDLPAWLDGPIGMTTLRGLRNLARRLPGVSRENAQAVVVITPVATVPAELMGHATVIEWPLPDREEIAAILDAAVGALPEDMQAGANREREAAIDAAVGLAGEEAAACYARSLVQLRSIDPLLVSQEKRRVVARERVLEWIEPIEGGLDAVGGLDVLKAWLRQRALAYTPEARAYGLPAPKGVLLAGISGTGKTHCGRAIATAWGVPLLKLDLGALKSKFVGECHADDTEFLTETGMKSFDEIKDGELLATFNITTGALEYQKFTARHEHNFSGLMHHIVGRGLMVTPNHRIVYKRPKQQEWQIAEAEKAFSVSNVRIPVAPVSVPGEASPTFTVPGQKVRHGRGDPVTLPINDMIELLAYFVADGSTTLSGGRGVVCIAQQDGPLADRMRELLNYFGPANAWGVKSKSTPPVRNIGVQSIPLWCYLREHCGTNSETKRLPDWIVKASKEQLTVLWTAFMVTDGHKDKRGYTNVGYTTTSPVLAEQIQEIAFRLGMRVTVRRVVLDPPRKPQYTVSASPNNFFQATTIERVPYDGRVVCFSVPNGTLVTRRNGRWSISGNSERNLRRAFEVIEAIGRCVVLVDEMEKSLAGATQGAADGGVSADALGAFLSWMSDRKSIAFILATANDVSKLPPEIVRKGRFDELFWLDLPTAQERIDILIATLRAHGRGPTVFSGQFESTRLALADATVGFTGSEIAALVPEALFAAFADYGREIEIADLLAVAATVVPLSKTAAEKIESLRAWAAGRARAATSAEVVEIATARGRALDL